MFSEPWEAQAFALAVQLSAAGFFSWNEWSAALSSELQAARERGEPDDGSHYYHHWLVALEHLVSAKGLASLQEMAARKSEWIDAYRVRRSIALIPTHTGTHRTASRLNCVRSGTRAGSWEGSP